QWPRTGAALSRGLPGTSGALWRCMRSTLLILFVIASCHPDTPETAGQSPDAGEEQPVLPDTPQAATSSAAGKGVFAHVIAGGGTNVRFQDRWTFWARDTALAGTQLSYSWATLEPTPGQYNWDLVREHIAP